MASIHNISVISPLIISMGGSSGNVHLARVVLADSRPAGALWRGGYRRLGLGCDPC